MGQNTSTASTTPLHPVDVKALSLFPSLESAIDVGTINAAFDRHCLDDSCATCALRLNFLRIANDKYLDVTLCEIVRLFYICAAGNQTAVLRRIMFLGHGIPGKIIYYVVSDLVDNPCTLYTMRALSALCIEHGTTYETWFTISQLRNGSAFVYAERLLRHYHAHLIDKYMNDTRSICTATWVFRSKPVDEIEGRTLTEWYALCRQVVFLHSRFMKPRFSALHHYFWVLIHRRESDDWAKTVYKLLLASRGPNITAGTTAVPQHKIVMRSALMSLVDWSAVVFLQVVMLECDTFLSVLPPDIGRSYLIHFVRAACLDLTGGQWRCLVPPRHWDARYKKLDTSVR